MGDLRELLCEEVSSPGPEGYPARISASKTAVAVELHFVEPFPPLGQALHQLGIQGLNKPHLGGWQGVLSSFDFTLDYGEPEGV